MYRRLVPYESKYRTNRFKLVFFLFYYVLLRYMIFHSEVFFTLVTNLIGFTPIFCPFYRSLPDPEVLCTYIEFLDKLGVFRPDGRSVEFAAAYASVYDIFGQRVGPVEDRPGHYEPSAGEVGPVAAEGFTWLDYGQNLRGHPVL